MENEDIEKIIAEIARKDETETRTFFASDNEDHYYQGVLVNSRMVQFYIRPRIKSTHNLPLASNAKFLDFILHFDVSHWTDVPEPELKEKYKIVRKKFIEECDKIHPDDFVEIAYSRDLRCKHIDAERKNTENFGGLPLVYHPLGFETYTSSYTRRFDNLLPEVIEVKLVENIE